MSKSNIVLNNVMLINNGRAADFLKWIHYVHLFKNIEYENQLEKNPALCTEAHRADAHGSRRRSRLFPIPLSPTLTQGHEGKRLNKQKSLFLFISVV